MVPVGLGSAVEVREDPKSLPTGYEPLSGEANGVPYANPVQLDAAVAGAAVLFVNVPSSVAELAQEAAPELERGRRGGCRHTISGKRVGQDRLRSGFSRGTQLYRSIPGRQGVERRWCRHAFRSPSHPPAGPSSSSQRPTRRQWRLHSRRRPRRPLRQPRWLPSPGNPVRMSAGVWSRPDRTRSRDWLWRSDRDHDRAHDWRCTTRALDLVGR